MIQNKFIHLFSILIILASEQATAAEKTFVKEYVYRASDIDSKVSSRAIALDQTKRLLLEELGTYILSETEIKNNQISIDQITTLTAGIVTTTIVDEKWDGKSYYLKAKLTSDPQHVVKAVEALRKDKENSQELKEARRTAKEALLELDRLKASLRSSLVSKIEQNKYDKAINDLSSIDIFYAGFTLLRSNNYRAAISAFSKAVELSPQNADAYSNRGLAYNNLGNYEEAMKNYNMAISIKPTYAKAYVLRGVASANLGNQDDAMTDYKTAIELAPSYADAFYYLGKLHVNICDEYHRKIAWDRQGEESCKDGLRSLVIAARLDHKQAQEYLKARNFTWK